MCAFKFFVLFKFRFIDITKQIAAAPIRIRPCITKSGSMSRRAAARELEDYHMLSNPDLVYFPRNITDSILARQVTADQEFFRTLREHAAGSPRLPADDRKALQEQDSAMCWSSPALMSRRAEKFRPGRMWSPAGRRV